MHRHVRHSTTEYISLNSHLCEACWQCIEACPNSVIGKIDMPFHKHARIENPDKCQGCRKCIKVCPQQAITAFSTKEVALPVKHY